MRAYFHQLLQQLLKHGIQEEEDTYTGKAAGARELAVGAGGSGDGGAKNEKKEKKDIFSYSNGESPTLLAAAECEVKRLREKLERKRIQVLRLI